jgi:hypothetical protein
MEGKLDKEFAKSVVNMLTHYAGIEVRDEAHAKQVLEAVNGCLFNQYKFDVDKAILYIKARGKFKWLFLTVIDVGIQRLVLITSTDKEKLTKKDGSYLSSGVVCTVYNATDPDLSEMGCCFFEKTQYGIERIA